MSYLQRFPYEQVRQLQSDVETFNQLVANLTKRLNGAAQLEQELKFKHTSQQF